MGFKKKKKRIKWGFICIPTFSEQWFKMLIYLHFVNYSPSCWSDGYKAGRLVCLAVLAHPFFFAHTPHPRTLLSLSVLTAPERIPQDTKDRWKAV